MSNNVGSAIAKIAALTGGAVLGAILANWFDRFTSERAQTRSDYDKNRYQQGLTPLKPVPPQGPALEQTYGEQAYNEENY